MHEQTIAVILAGGVGTRLYPLTADRAKPAVPFGGKYRIIDFVLANCLHSDVRKILVLTQYKSHSLHKHLRDGWSIFNPELDEYITAVPPQMRTGEQWYAGTADAIYQNLYLLKRSGAKTVLILSGDHIYRMDYAAMLAYHKQQHADVTIAGMETSIENAKSLGVLSVNADSRIFDFNENPAHPISNPTNPETALVSMGIYVFSIDLLINAIEQDHRTTNSSHDFGKNIFPNLAKSNKVFAYQFGGSNGRVTSDRYWQDMSTLDIYFEANMALLESVPQINLYQPDWPIRTHQGQFPPARTVAGSSCNEGVFINSIVSGGVIISGGSVHHSVLFPNVRVYDGAIVENAILFEGVTIGEGAHVRNCIIDKQVSVPEGENIGLGESYDQQKYTISDNGIIIVPKNMFFQRAGM